MRGNTVSNISLRGHEICSFDHVLVESKGIPVRLPVEGTGGRGTGRVTVMKSRHGESIVKLVQSEEDMFAPRHL